jgi:hypothetical protein
VYWVVKYIYSSDPSKASASDPCGPGPFSTEVLENINTADFQVVDGKSPSSEAQVATVVTQLRSTPTGFLQTTATEKPSGAMVFHNSRSTILWITALLGSMMLSA